MFNLAQEIVRKQLLGQFTINNGLNNVLSIAGNLLAVRWASKKTGGSTRNRKSHPRPKHRRIFCGENHPVQTGMILVRQNKLRLHPGLNVGFGRNATLFALRPGKVIITCEKIDPNMDHTWVSPAYSGRDISRIYKKFIHVIPEKQHNVFRQIDPMATVKAR